MKAFGAPSASGKSSAWSLAWLTYLVIYILPWFGGHPRTSHVIAAVAGVAVFLVIYFDAYFSGRRSVIPHVIAMAALGFALSPFGGAWSVFNIYAANLLATSAPRRTAIVGCIGMGLVLITFGVVLNKSWYEWTPGVFFGALSAYGSMTNADVRRRNRQLLETQDEVRALSAVAERERIARDLHDLLGHTLTLVAVKADLATRVAERDPEAARREMQAVAEVARDALGQVRDAVTGMTGLTFAGEVERARSMLDAASVDVRISTPDALADPKREAVLAMALREAVTNVIRHADAKQCSIELEARPNGDLRLSVADDGRGGDFQEGSGLRGMRARLLAAGGALEVKVSAAGARVTATLPARAAA